MNKWFAVVALGAAMAVAGCESDGNGADSTDPKKMSLNSDAACKTECDASKQASKEAAAPKKLSAGAGSADCQTQCPAAKSN